MASSSEEIKWLDKADINSSLETLDAMIGDSELLMSVAPIRFMAIGGMLAVSVFQNRETTKDIDVLLDPAVSAVAEYRDAVFELISEVGTLRGLSSDWMNDELKIFIHNSKKLSLFLESVEQNLVAYNGNNMVIYAGRLDFALERKLRRLVGTLARYREWDLSDAVAFTRWIKGDGPALSVQYLRNLDENNIGYPVQYEAIDMLRNAYSKKYGEEGVESTE